MARNTSILLGEHFEEFISAKVSSGKYNSASEVIRTALRLLEAEEFSVINQQYDYAFTSESNVAKWVSFSPNQLVLEKGETKKIPYTVAVPLLTEPGGRYVGMFASTNTSSGSGILSKQRLASLLYINVTGDVTRIGKLVSLTSPWLISGDSNWNMTIQNKGSTHFRSRYSLEIKDVFGGRVGGTKGESLILPNTVRLLDNKLPLPNWPGIYIANYNIGLGDTPARQDKRVFIYSPIWFTTVLISILTAGIIRLSISKRNKRSK